MSEYPVEYCDYCEQEGHTFRTCPRRDDCFDEPDELEREVALATSMRRARRVSDKREEVSNAAQPANGSGGRRDNDRTRDRVTGGAPRDFLREEIAARGAGGIVRGSAITPAPHSRRSRWWRR